MYEVFIFPRFSPRSLPRANTPAAHVAIRLLECCVWQLGIITFIIQTSSGTGPHCVSFLTKRQKVYVSGAFQVFHWIYVSPAPHTGDKPGLRHMKRSSFILSCLIAHYHQYACIRLTPGVDFKDLKDSLRRNEYFHFCPFFKIH